MYAHDLGMTKEITTAVYVFFPIHRLFVPALGNEKVTTITYQHKSESYCSTHAFACSQLVLLNSLNTQTPFSKSCLVLRTGTSLKNTLFFPGALALVPITEKSACLLVWLSHNSKLCRTLFCTAGVANFFIPP